MSGQFAKLYIPLTELLSAEVQEEQAFYFANNNA